MYIYRGLWCRAVVPDPMPNARSHACRYSHRVPVPSALHVEHSCYVLVRLMCWPLLQTLSIERPGGTQSKVALTVALELYRIGPAPCSDYHSDMESDDESEAGGAAYTSQQRELVVSATAIYKRLGALRAF